MTVTRKPLASAEAEQAYLGALLLDPEAKFAVMDRVRPEMFFDAAHGIICKAIYEVTTPDIISVGAWIESAGLTRDIGGKSYLSKLIAESPGSVHVSHYGDIVLTTHQLRQMAQLGDDIRDLIYSGRCKSVVELWGKVQGKLMEMKPAGEETAVMTWRESLIKYVGLREERVEEWARVQAGTDNVLSLPWEELCGPGKINRVRPGTLMLIAAKSGVGKTAMAEALAEHWAEHGFHVVFYHAEIDPQGMLDRRACRHTHVPLYLLERGEISDEELFSYADRLDKWSGEITYVHCPGWKASQIASHVRRTNILHPVDVVIVDYLQKLTYEGDNSYGLTSAQARGAQVEAFKTTAEMLEIPFVLLSQLNREGRIRDSGEIEEKSNIRMHLLRKPIGESTKVARYGEDDEDKEAELEPEATVKVFKNTFGRPFTCKLWFDGPTYSWLSAVTTKLPDYSVPKKAKTPY